jgi:hypothetical protein
MLTLPEVVHAAEARRVDVVDGLRSWRPRREPTVPRDPLYFRAF